MTKFGKETLEPKRSVGGRKYTDYDKVIAVAVNRSGIVLLGKVNEVCENYGYANLHVNGSEWAIEPTKSHSGFKLSRGGGHSTRANWNIISPVFISKRGLATNAIYIGKFEEGFFVFSKMPSEIL